MPSSPNRVEMRTRIAWRILVPTAAIVWFVLDTPATAWSRYGLTGVFLLEAAAAWRDYVRIEDGVLYQRRLLGWSAPLVLTDVTSITLHYEMFGRDLPHRELGLQSPQTWRYLSLRWWHNWRPVLEAVTAAVSEPSPSGHGRTWNVEIDDKTRRRLEYI